MLSLRIRNFNSERIKVNDLHGNPIEIAAVIVWRVVDSARAIFDVQNYEQFVAIQGRNSNSYSMPQNILTIQMNDEKQSLRGSPTEDCRKSSERTSDKIEVAGVKLLKQELATCLCTGNCSGNVTQTAGSGNYCSKS